MRTNTVSALLVTIQSVWCRLVGLLLPSTMRKHLTVGMLETRVRRGIGTDSDFEMLDELQMNLDLGLTPTQELVHELMGRYDVACFVGTKPLSGDHRGITYAVVGDSLRRMGLNTWVRMTTFKEFEE